MGTEFYRLLGSGEISRLGDIVRAAKTTIAGSDVAYSFVLLADPTLKAR